jgi:hypothetical protein
MVGCKAPVGWRRQFSHPDREHGPILGILPYTIATPPTFVRATWNATLGDLVHSGVRLEDCMSTANLAGGNQPPFRARERANDDPAPSVDLPRAHNGVPPYIPSAHLRDIRNRVRHMRHPRNTAPLSLLLWRRSYHSSHRVISGDEARGYHALAPKQAGGYPQPKL